MQNGAATVRHRWFDVRWAAGVCQHIAVCGAGACCYASSQAFGPEEPVEYRQEDVEVFFGPNVV
jgi:hypothetical protein